MNIFAEIRTAVIAQLEALKSEGVLPEMSRFDAVTVEAPRDAAHGDMAINAAMVLAKPAGLKPRDLAETIVARLHDLDAIASAEIAGPGFINVRLTESLWTGVVTTVLEKGAAFGRSDLGQGEKVNVEFVSANPTGPLHVGHVRGAVVGDALASLYSAVGYDVTREYYINDGGAQVDVLARSVYLRYLEAHGRAVEFPDGTYPGDYLITVGEMLKTEFGDQFVDQPESAWLTIFREKSTDAMMQLIRNDLARLGVHMDVFFSEKSLYGSGRIEKAIQRLDDAGLIYTGTLPPPKGKEQDDWEPREQTLFKSTEFGDDVDRPIQKSDGGWTYFAPDIAYHFDKIDRGFDRLIDVLGADHGGYVKRMQAAVSALSGKKANLDVKLCQLVRLFKNGEPFKMSKRAGNFVLLSDVLDEVGPDVTRFVILTRKSDQTLDFDFAKVLEQSRENPVFYVQYAHARTVSILKKATDVYGDVGDGALKAADLSLLSLNHETDLIRKIAEWPKLVEAAADAGEPHRLAFYLYDLASAFHSAQHVGKIDPEARFIVADDHEQTLARLALVHAVQTVIANGLCILGVTPAQEMR